eukprot:TRINITY_DN3302_c0_g1_i9.p2 TRINITY_DN3302_c0_g1~~TRINITY_DN3302_c0_g1_i9.p2  ORF type:complete len:249 (+),score=54.28 TRINITY_DN3302_c0_g1_i9:53-799(+)
MRSSACTFFAFVPLILVPGHAERTEALAMEESEQLVDDALAAASLTELFVGASRNLTGCLSDSEKTFIRAEAAAAARAEAAATLRAESVAAARSGVASAHGEAAPTPCGEAIATARAEAAAAARAEAAATAARAEAAATVRGEALPADGAEVFATAPKAIHERVVVRGMPDLLEDEHVVGRVVDRALENGIGGAHLGKDFSVHGEDAFRGHIGQHRANMFQKSVKQQAKRKSLVEKGKLIPSGQLRKG